MRKTSSAFLYQAGAVLLAVIVLSIVGRYVPVVEVVSRLQQMLSEAGIRAPIAYPFVIAVCNVLLLPAGVLSFGGGFFFGLWWGFFLVLFGNVSGAAGAFLIGRMLGRKRIERLLRHRSKWVYLDDAIRREGWKVIVLSQIHPLFPVSLINYIYGITRIPFWTCMLWTTVGRAPGILLYVYIGTLGQLGLRLLKGTSNPKAVEFVIWIGGLLLLFALTLGLGRLALRLLREAEEKASGGVPRDADAPAAMLNSDL